VYFQGGIGVKKNIVVGGDVFVDGRVFADRIHTPLEWHETEKITLKGKMLGGHLIGSCPDGNVTSKDCDLCIEIYPHSHAFKSI
jgi:hypothetical protein